MVRRILNNLHTFFHHFSSHLVEIMDGLIGVTYSEFDNRVGPQLRMQYPEGVLSEESFETLSDYVIVGKQLLNRVIVVKHESYQFANYSVAIDNAKYERNALLFALGIVFKIDADTKPYEAILRKACSMLVSLELEREFLFNKDTKKQVAVILENLFIQLKNTGEVFMKIDAANVLCLKLFKEPLPPAPVDDWEVPVLLYDNMLLLNIPWELSMRHLIPHIDGRRSTKSIAREAEVDVDIVKKSIRVLIWYGIVAVTDAVRFSNVYQTTDRITDLLNPERGLDRLCQLMYMHPGPGTAVASSGDSGSGGGGDVESGVSQEQEHQQQIAIARKIAVERVLMGLEPGLPLKDLILSLLREDFPLTIIDFNRLIAIAQHLGIIRRVHEYPVKLSKHHEDTSSSSRPGAINSGFSDHDGSPLGSHNNHKAVSNRSSKRRESERVATPPLHDERPRSSDHDLSFKGRSSFGDGLGDGLAMMTARPTSLSPGREDGLSQSASDSEIDFLELSSRDAMKQLLGLADGKHHLSDLSCKFRIAPDCKTLADKGIVLIRR